MSVGEKEITIPHSILALLTISKENGITKCLKAAVCILSLIELAPKFDTLILVDFLKFQNEPFSSNPNISGKYEPN